MKVNITGYVQENRKRIEGIVDLPDDEARRLIDLKVAEPVSKEEYPLISVNTETGEVSQVKDAENESLKAENQKLKAENESLALKNFNLAEMIKQANNPSLNEALKAENENLIKENQSLLTELNDARSDIHEFEVQVANLSSRITELENQLKQNSDSSTGETSSKEMSEAEKEYRAMENKLLIELINQRGIELGKASKKDDYVALLLKNDAEKGEA